MQVLTYLIIFLLLVAGMFFIMDINPIRRKMRISLSKNTVEEKRKQVDEKYSRLKFSEKILVSINNVVSMSGFTTNAFWLFVALSGLFGYIAGKFLFLENVLALVTALIALPLPYIILKIRARWYRRNQEEMLENTMNLITNSYISCNDIIKAVSENLDKLDIPKPFEEFITDVTFIDSNIKRALQRLELKINNKYFSEWIDILCLSQEKSGDYRFVLPAIIQSMNDAKRLQIEADTVMMQVWRDYFTSILLSFSIIPLLRWSNSEWFEILVCSPVGRFFVITMLIMTLVSAFLTLKINKPL